MSKSIGLLLTAGGARGAYQAGVLKRMGELPRFEESNSKESPFKIVSGASAGAINGAAVAAGSLDFPGSTRLLADLWSALKVGDIFRSDPAALTSIAASWVRDLSVGGIFGGGRVQSLLDATPLQAFLERNLRLDGIQESIDRGVLEALAISATSYASGKSYTFIQGREGHPTWVKSRKVAYSVRVGVAHVRASCAIPLVFQPVLVEAEFGDYYYGDGALRLVNPFSPPIRLGAEKVFAIGIRADRLPDLKELSDKKMKKSTKRPTLADVFGVSLNAIFLDHLDADLEHLNRMNDLIRAYNPESVKHAASLKEPIRLVEPLVIKPSQDIGRIADGYTHRMPRAIRYLMEGLGTSKVESADLMSYLLFDEAYTKALVDLGYSDAHRQIEAIEDFLFSKS